MSWNNKEENEKNMHGTTMKINKISFIALHIEVRMQSTNVNYITR